MHRRHLRLGLGALIAVLSLMVAGTATSAPQKVTAGTVTFGAEQEPPCLNGFLEGCNNTWTSWTAGIALRGLYIVKPNFTLAPDMGSARIVSRKPFTLVATIKKNAKWSDGKQVTADDLIFTWQTIVNPKWEIAGRSGWDSLSRVKKLSAKSVRLTFKQPYAPWKVMLSTSVLPKHALQGENFNEVWNNNYNNKSGATMATGPYKLAGYTKGQSLTMVKNPAFYGRKPSIDRHGMVRQLFLTLNPRLPVLQNVTYTNQQPQYKAHFQRYARNLQRVNSLMTSHGCRKGGDGIWACGGNRASVRLGTTAGNRLRELAVEVLQAQGKAAGFEFKPDSQPSRLFFPRLSEANYDIALFAWVGTGDPAGQVDIYGCGGGSNWKGYCNRTVTNMLRRSDAALNAAQRARLVNSADVLLANDAITIPLYQKPTYFVYKSRLRGAVDNPTLQGPTWNTEAWRVG